MFTDRITRQEPVEPMPPLKSQLDGKPPNRRTKTVIYEASVHAEPSPHLMFSRITQGASAEELRWLKTPTGELSSSIYFWAIAGSPDKPEYLRDYFMEGLKFTAPRLYHKHLLIAKEFGDAKLEEREPYDSEIYDELFSRMKDILGDMMKYGGGDAMVAFGKKLKRIEKAYRKPTHEEKDLLHSIEFAAKEKGRIPYQKEVKNHWFSLRSNRTENGFRKTRDATGFKWLPPATRGKRAVPK